MSINEEAIAIICAGKDITFRTGVERIIRQYEAACNTSGAPDDCRAAFDIWFDNPLTLGYMDVDILQENREAFFEAFQAGAKPKREPADELAEGVLKLTKMLRYIQGIVERGENRKLGDDECVDIAILNYVKKLEDTESLQQEYYKRGWKEAQEHYTKRESGDYPSLRTAAKNAAKSITALKSVTIDKGEVNGLLSIIESVKWLIDDGVRWHGDFSDMATHQKAQHDRSRLADYLNGLKP